jgi:hypothetical protein
MLFLSHESLHTFLRFEVQPVDLCEEYRESIEFIDFHKRRTCQTVWVLFSLDDYVLVHKVIQVQLLLRSEVLFAVVGRSLLEGVRALTFLDVSIYGVVELRGMQSDVINVLGLL